MRGRAISPYRSLLWGIIFYESEALAPRNLKDDNDTVFLNEPTKLTDRNARSEKSLGFN